MKTVVFVGKGQAVLQDERTPDCPSDGMLLKTMLSGMTNGTERNQLMGGNYGGHYPIKSGYQLVSRVVECGEEVGGYKEGDVLYTGTFKGHVEYHTARPSDLLIRLPEGFDLESAALLGVTSVPYHDAERAAVRSSDNVLIFGAGLIGQFAAQVCRVLGAGATVIDLSEERLTLARQLGADRVIQVGKADSRSRLEEGAPYSVVFEASGANVLDTIIGKTWGEGMIGNRARVLMIAGRDEVAYSFNAAQSHEVAVLHAGHFDRSDLESVVTHVAAGNIEIRPLIKTIVPIDDAIRIYDTLRDSPNELLGTVFRWD